MSPTSRPVITPEKSIQTSVTCPLRPGHKELDGFIGQGCEQAAQYRPGHMLEEVPGVHPQAEHQQEALQHILTEMRQLAHDVHGEPVGGREGPDAEDARCTIPSTRPLAPSDTSAICREFEKMNTMQPMRAKVKITRHAMSHGEVR